MRNEYTQMINVLYIGSHNAGLKKERKLQIGNFKTLKIIETFCFECWFIHKKRNRQSKMSGFITVIS